MTWPGWGDVLPALAALLAALGAVIGGMVALARHARPWMREAAREAASEVSAEVKALAEKLATNDFPHMEARIERGLQAVRDRLDRARRDRKDMEGRIGERINDMGGRIERMEKRLLAAVRQRPDTDDSEA